MCQKLATAAFLILGGIALAGCFLGSLMPANQVDIMINHWLGR